MKERNKFLILACIFPLLVAEQPSMGAKKAKLTPAKRAALRKNQESFKACKKQVLVDLKAGNVKKKQVKKQLATCRERFPSAGLFIDCKKKAKITAKKKKVPYKKVIRGCQKLLAIAMFDPKDPIPAFVNNNQLYFAGIGLNSPTRYKKLIPPNFDCSKIHKKPTPEFILFGNHLKNFQGVEDEALEKLTEKHQLKKGQEKRVEGLGMVYSDPTEDDSLVFFPVASCSFTAKTGRLFQGLTAYYLLNEKTKTAIPYFGVVFYKKSAKKLNIGKISKRLLKQFGSGYKIQEKKPNLTFVTTQEIDKFDVEGDPANVCNSEKTAEFLAIIKARKGAPTSPEYLIFANVKNLCSYGNQVAKTLAKL